MKRVTETKTIKSEVFNCDCMEGMKQYPDKHFELAIVDPPYGIGNWIQTTGNVSPNFKNVAWNESGPNVEYFNELRRISVDRIVWGANYYNSFEESMGAIIWHKFTNKEVHFSECEIASYSKHKRVGYVFIPWTSGFFRNDDGGSIHPCQKPVALYKWLLKNYAKPGDKILDTHMGSQSSRIAAYDMGFDYTGFELDPDYFAAGCKRFEQHKAQLKIF